MSIISQREVKRGKNPNGASEQKIEELLQRIKILSPISEFERQCAAQVAADAARLESLFASPAAATIQLVESSPSFPLTALEILYLVDMAGKLIDRLPQELTLKEALLMYLSPEQAKSNALLRGELSRLTAFVFALPEQHLLTLFGLNL